MGSRRPPGSGTIVAYEKAGHTYYRAVIDVSEPGGKRRRKAFSGTSRTAVLRKMQQWRKANPVPSLVTDPRLTLGDYLAGWLSSHTPSVRESTAVRYAQFVRLLPESLRNRTLASITPEDLEAAYRELLSAGYAPNTVLHTHRLLHEALGRAERRGYVARNVAALADAPRVRRTEVVTLSAPQLLELLRAARGDRFEALYVLAVTTGMRQGELLALRWQDIDWAAPAVMVRGSLRLLSDGLKRRETKSGRERRVLLTPTAVAALRQHRARQRGIYELVFTRDDGRPVAHTVIDKNWRALRARAGLPQVTFHAATRHAAASLLVAAGIHARVVADILGHSTIGVTMDTYSHILDSGQTEAAAAMERMLAGYTFGYT